MRIALLISRFVFFCSRIQNDLPRKNAQVSGWVPSADHFSFLHSESQVWWLYAACLSFLLSWRVSFIYFLFTCVCQDFRLKRERNRDVTGFGCPMKYGVDVNSIQMYSFNQTGLRRGRPFAPTWNIWKKKKRGVSIPCRSESFREEGLKTIIQKGEWVLLL